MIPTLTDLLLPHLLPLPRHVLEQGYARTELSKDKKSQKKEGLPASTETCAANENTNYTKVVSHKNYPFESTAVFAEPSCDQSRIHVYSRPIRSCVIDLIADNLGEISNQMKNRIHGDVSILMK